MYFIYSKIHGVKGASTIFPDTIYHRTQTLRGELYTWCDQKISDRTKKLGAIRHEKPEGLQYCKNCAKVKELYV